jgi:hypothetical protein
MSLDWKQHVPVLHAVYDLLDSHDHVDSDDVCEQLGRGKDDPATLRALDELREAGFIRGQRANMRRTFFIQSAPLGLQTARGWPRPGELGAEGVEQFLAVLDERLAAAVTEEERGAWQRFRSAAGSTAPSVLGEVLGAWVSRVTLGPG